jgi:hypothetical protein
MATQSGNFKYFYLILQPQKTKPISKNLPTLAARAVFL